MKKKSKGLIFEQAIVSGISEDITLVPQEDIDHARALLKDEGVDLQELPKHKFKFREKGDPKTDIYFKKENKEFKISVKYKSSVQLCSINKDSAAKYLSLAASKSKTNSEKLAKFIKSLDSLPKGVLSQEYKDWEQENKKPLNSELQRLLTESPKLKESLADVAITGNGLFEDSRAVANYVLTEDKLVKVNPDYIKACADIMTAGFRSKSRRNKKTNQRLSEANFRIDLKMREIKVAKERS